MSVIVHKARRKLEIENKLQKMVIIMQAILFVVIIILAILLVKEKSYWQGYNEAYDTGVKSGWQSCIEENNLYGRYEHDK